MSSRLRARARSLISSACRSKPADGFDRLAVGGVEFAAPGGHGGLNREDRCSGERVRGALRQLRCLRQRPPRLVETSQLQQRFPQPASRQRLA